MTQTIGRYLILDALGRGGMGVVYRAQHVETGQTVALKTVLVPDHSLLQSIRREIHALARIRHPGVVRIVDEGLHEGLPWYAMELLEGVELRQFCTAPRSRPTTDPFRLTPRSVDTRPAPAEPLPEQKAHQLWTLSLQTGVDEGFWTSRPAPTPRLPRHEVQDDTVPAALADLERTLRASTHDLRLELSPGGPIRDLDSEARQRSVQAAEQELPAAAGGALPLVLTTIRRLCGPLAFLHGEGIVHRDLKPSNVLVQSNGEPVLMDFGLVTQFSGEVSREALDIGEVAVGTVGYMAPEQIRGELVDARADLYSLGCILYELVTGRQPFVRATVAEVARAHLKATPLPPSQFVGGVPAELDAVILRLLAKRPRDRLGHADDVAAALAELGAEDSAGASTRRPRPYLYRPGFAGRSEPLAILEQHLHDLQDKRGAIVLIGGESGVGKTRLAMELAHKVAASRGLVLTGECLDVGGRPLEALRKPLQAIADRCRALGEAETERLFGPRGKVLARYEPDIAGLPGQERYAEPAELQGPTALARIQTYVAETLEALALTEPVLLIVDDLQWADELSLGVLEFLARRGRLEQVPLLVLANYRTEEVGPALEKLLRLEDCTQLHIGRLDEEAVAAIVGDMLGLQPPPQVFSRFLTRQSEGNPFFVAEYLRTALAEGVLWRDVRGRWRIAEDRQGEATEEIYESLPLPRSLRDLLERHLDVLPERARKVVEAMAVLGREAGMALLRELSSLEEKELLEATSELLRRQIFEEPGPGRLRFVHDKSRTVAYGTLQEPERRRLHSIAARAVREVLSEMGESAAAIARHHDAAGEITEARVAYQQAAEEARARYANEEALRLYRRAEELWHEAGPEATRARTELALGQARVHRVLGRYAEAEKDLSRAGEMAAALGDRRQQGLTLIERADIAWRTSLPQETERLANAAEALGRELGDRSLQAAATRYRAIAWYYLGQKQTAITEMQRASDLARDSGDPALESQVTENLATLFFLSGRSSLAIPLLERLIPQHRSAGRRERQAIALTMLGQARGIRGEFAESLQCHTEAVEVARKIGSPDAEMRALSSLAGCYDELHQVYKALDAATRATKLAQELGDRTVLALSYRLRCRQARFLKNTGGARELLQQAQETAESARLRPVQVYLLADEALLAAASGTASEVRQAASRAIAMLQPQEELGRGLGYHIRSLCARAAVDVGARDLVMSLLATMREQVLYQAETNPQDMGWGCLTLPALLADLEAPSFPTSPRPPEAHESLPQLWWQPGDWLRWGKQELDRLLERLPADLAAGFLAHPDHQLKSLLKAEVPG